jgi:hypothetical protein
MRNGKCLGCAQRPGFRDEEFEVVSPGRVFIFKSTLSHQAISKNSA